MRDLNEALWWRRTWQLAAATFGGLVVLVLVPIAFGAFFAKPAVLGLPFSAFLLIVVAPLFIAGSTFAFAARQQRLDRRHDVAEE